MRIIDGFKLRSIAGEMVVSGEGVAQINFNKLLALNETAAYLWQSVEGKEFDVESLADLLANHYEVERATALSDAQALLDKWVECGVVEK